MHAAADKRYKLSQDRGGITKGTYQNAIMLRNEQCFMRKEKKCAHHSISKIKGVDHDTGAL